MTNELSKVKALWNALKGSFLGIIFSLCFSIGVKSRIFSLYFGEKKNIIFPFKIRLDFISLLPWPLKSDLKGRQMLQEFVLERERRTKRRR